MIRVYNTLARTKQPFEPVRPGRVGIYLCGPTVYKPSHIGHMVGPVIFDTIKRYLQYSGYEVTLVVNITDVDDKLIAESAARGIAMPQLAEEMIADYLENIRAMGVDSIDHFPRCTDKMDAIIDFIAKLVEQDHAYASEGDVYFDVSKSAEYGKLSGRQTEAMLGDGGGTAARKRSSADFALWKSAKPGEPSWPSPWGPGRPGWHIECSAMSHGLLGETFDIHGGGLDLIFPHHENEIAQSEARYGRPMAKYWLHNGLMQASGEVGKVGGRQTRAADDHAAQEAGKISKSKGSSAFKELLQQYQPETIRYFLLSTHYRRPIDYSPARLEETETALENFYRFFKRYQRVAGESFYDLTPPARREEGDLSPGESELLKTVDQHRQRFLEAMDDDFNTGGAIGELFELLRALNRFVDQQKLEDEKARSAEKLEQLRRGTLALRELTAVLGLFREPIEAPAAGDDQLTGKLIELLIEIRADARKNKDFATADKVRDRLGEIGVKLEDRPSGTEWTIE